MTNPRPPGARSVARADSPTLDSGKVVGRRYRITKPIGAGGMGAVYEATDLETGAAVALKALPRGAYDAANLERLRAEANAATAVRSDYVCRVFYLWVDRGVPFIVMERLRGQTLRERLRGGGGGGRPDLEECVTITAQLLRALEATHAAGLVHRDVKPSNVFLLEGETTRVKLIDFGLAKHEVDRDDPSAIPGTMQYLAPEQLLGAGIDQRVDVRAAGLILYEVLTGRRAFGGATAADIVQRVVLEEPPRLAAARPDVPPIFDDVLAMAVARDRARRFATARAFRTALETAWHWESAHTSGERPSAPEESDGIDPSADDDPYSDTDVTLPYGVSA